MRILVFLTFLILAVNGHAFSWTDLWFTKDQQGQQLMKKGDFKAAESTFAKDDWRAAAAYKAGNYQNAEKYYQSIQNETGYYNQGNTLAHQQHYEEALKAYDKALALNPNNKDALYNRKLIAELLKKKQKEQDKDQQEKNSQDQNQQKQDKQQNNQQDKDKQKQDQQQNNQQEQDKQKQDQQQNNQQGQDQQKQDQRQKNQQDQDQQKEDQQLKDQQAKSKQAEQAREEREKQQAKEQWLRLIPDDPGGLMREKFLRDHIRRQGGWYQ